MGALLNTDTYTWVNNHDPGYCRQEPQPSMFTVRNFKDQWDYYYVGFKDADAFEHLDISTFIPEDILEKIKDPHSQTLLLLCNQHEAFISAVEYIYKFVVIQQQVPAHKVVLMTGAFNIMEEVDRVSSVYKLPQLKVELELPFEHSASRFYHDEIFERPDDIDNPSFNTWLPPKTLHDGPYKKKYLNFNRRWRLHRPTMVALLKNAGILEQGHVSLAPSDDDYTWEKAIPYMLEMHQEFPKVVDIINNMKTDLINQEPLYLDTQDLVTNRAKVTQDHNWLYEETYFSLISETCYYNSHWGYESAQFLSEKVWKSILFKHPFIVISTPGILRCLKHIGYKTFEDIIDESYDKIVDDGDRLLAIVKETERLCNLSDADLKKFLTRAREICDYNFNILTTKENFYHKMNFV